MIKLLFSLIIFSLFFVNGAYSQSASEDELYLQDFDEEFSNEGEDFFEEDPNFRREGDETLLDSKAKDIAEFIRDRFAGSLIGLRYRNEVRDGVGSSDINRMQYQVKLKINIPIVASWKLKLEPQTGDDSWSSGWDDAFATGDDSKFENDMTFRRIYLQSYIAETSKIQAGAIPARPKRSISTPLNVDTDGWIDGLRYVYGADFRLLKQISGTYGQIDFSDGDFYDRSWDFSDDKNEYAQIQFDGYLHDFISYNAELNRVHEEDYSRIHLNVDMKTIFDLEKSYLIFEEINSLKGFDSLGRSIGFLKRDINWLTQFAYVENDQADTTRLLTMGPTRPEGRQLFFFYERKLTGDNTVWFLRLRRCIERNVCQNDYRAELAIRYKM